MAVLIENRQKKLNVPLSRIQKKAQFSLNALGCPDGELSILIVDDPQIAALNQKHLKRQGPTNVLAFPMKTDQFSGIIPLMLGDVVISVETAQRESKTAGIHLEERLDQLLVHGILHLFDYDHEQGEEKALDMEEKNNELLTLIKDKSF